ncbi:TAXI family TRAP transporter solute-binding subunit [Thalassospira lucentensis]|uniref:TAXI family TRAP transporter solute-binding subunit n=1 Tax=Thalassospira lucentensis TaxID=168935 RepID=UPI0011BF7B14|nr:TAXI family TRAP transporter solute-binding subunit [Thalassospira lucentensis]
MVELTLWFSSDGLTKPIRWTIVSLYLVCGMSAGYAQDATTADSAQASARKAEAFDVDQYDADDIKISDSNPDMVDGWLYKPDAIPLSQYRRKSQGPDSLIALSNATEIMGDGKSERSYYAAIYSGSTNGVYFQVAAKICDMMRRSYKRHRVHCVPLRSQGVGSNIQLMKEGRVQLAIVQSNNNWEAQAGVNPIPGARSVMSLHDEMGLLIVRQDSEIESIADLRGKRINIGPEGSASRELWLELLGQYDITLDDMETIYSVAQDYNRLGICEDYIDAFGLWIGHPASIIEDSLACDAKVIGMGGPLTQKLVSANHYFFDQVLPARTYDRQEQAINSYGFKASLMAYEVADPYVVYWVTRIIHENIEQLKTEFPTFRSVMADDMYEKGNFLPFHKGAACYWETDLHACDWQQFYNEPDSVSNAANTPYTYMQ